MTPDEHCQQLAEKSGSSFYYSFLFLPPEQRRAITALYAFCREVDDVVDECSDSSVARSKLAWWRAEVTRLYTGEPQHPVTMALLEPVKRYNLAQEHLLEIIDGMEMDLEQTHYATFKELSLYCYRVASVVGLLSAEIFGYEDRQTLKYAHDLGMAFQLTNILRDVKEDVARGRVYLPEDELTRFGVTLDDLRAGRMHDGLRQLLQFQAERARHYYDTAFQRLPEIDRYHQRSGLIMAAIYLTTLDRIEALGYPVLQQRVSLPLLRKLWLAWRTARLETRRFHKYQSKVAHPKRP
ncbi:MAG TPA: presqualene diphosphate synthase HpnD [Gammaproteobacteria bacterium]